MRLQKYMADAGIASRRKCEEYITQGRVRINGVTATLGQSVSYGDFVEFDGKAVSEPTSNRVVIMLNKPRGVLSTCSDPSDRRTTAEFFKDIPYRVYNVGRLDYDSEGLLLFTNDGDLAYRLTHPKFEVEKTYRVLLEGEVTAEGISRLKNGVVLTDGITAPARVEGVSISSGSTSLYITIHEGRNRQIRRMCEAIGHKTLRLRRVAIGSLRLSGLRAGQWRYLTDTEIKSLIGSYGE